MNHILLFFKQTFTFYYLMSIHNFFNFVWMYVRKDMVKDIQIMLFAD